MSRKLSIAGLCVVGALCIVKTESSAIPMWEYLSRGEKMSHLFNMFVQQVEKHCSEHQQAEPDCNKQLLVHGLTNLANMEDHSLDDMDPYQRDANKIVWDSMMSGHEMKPEVPSRPQSLDEADEMSTGEELGAASSVHETQSAPQSFLLGPMVVRVLPNGQPIPGEKNELPKDEDVEEFAPSTFKMAEIAKHISSTPSTSTTTTQAPSSFNYYKPTVSPTNYFKPSQRYQQQQPPQQAQQRMGHYYQHPRPSYSQDPFYRVRSAMYPVY